MTPVFYVVGPTGSGKSALAAELAAEMGAAVVNGDAFQLYRGLEILTASPTDAERAAAPHFLYGVLNPAETCDAARYATMARQVLERLAAEKRPAIIVGGSGLYIKALTHGLADLPADEALRAELAARTAEDNIAELRRLDPAGAATMNLGNPRYVQRALELCRLTGRPASKLRAAWSGPDPAGLCGVRLEWPREELHRRIEARTRGLFSAGVVEEVQRLGPLSATAEKAIGLREVRHVLNGTMAVNEAVEAIATATRQYAKRQGTWFRREKWLQVLPMATDASLASALERARREWPVRDQPC